MKTQAEHLQALLPHCTVTRGHHLSGAGLSRFGYGARTASGHVQFLGRTAEEAKGTARRLGNLFGS